MKITQSRKIGLSLCATMCLSSCLSDSPPQTMHSSLGETKVMTSTADLRLVYERSRAGVGDHRVICAEPSPDLARAVSQTFSFGGGVTPAGTAPEVAIAIARARAESLAQLGERLASIQLLRDSLYRACEAYANGAINNTAYAIILSRYDDILVTLLGSEMAAGAFGRSLAGLTGSTDSSGGASTQAEESVRKSTTLARELTRNTSETRALQSRLTQSETRVREIERTLNSQMSIHRELETSLTEAVNRSSEIRRAIATEENQGVSAAGDSESVNENVETLEQQLLRNERRVADLQSQLSNSQRSVSNLSRQFEQEHSENIQLTNNLSESIQRNSELQTEQSRQIDSTATSSATAGVSVAGSITPGQQDAAIANTIATMGRKFMENINSEALEIACVVALDRPNDKSTAFTDFCKRGLQSGTSILNQVYAGKAKALKTIYELEEMTIELEKARLEEKTAQLESASRKKDTKITELESRNKKLEDEHKALFVELKNALIGKVKPPEGEKEESKVEKE